jgi:ABC-type Zn uptake system ZnuABC Zn-binding protein ZnuA
MKKNLWLSAMLVFALSCGASTAPPMVACTTTIVGDVVAEIAGEAVDVRVLLPVGADPHSFEPVPQDLVLLSNASIVFLNGADLEASLDPVLGGTAAPLVALSGGLDLLTMDEQDDHAHGDVDPHVWFDPTNVVEWTHIIEASLTELVPDEADRIAERALAYRDELAALDRWIAEQVSAVPPTHRSLVTDHAVFGYFAARYGFTQVGTVFPGVTTTSEPSAREIADLIDAIRNFDVTAIFTGQTVRTSLVEQVARDAGIDVVFIYTGSLSGPDGAAGTYLDLIRYDVTAIVEGLRPTDAEATE